MEIKRLGEKALISKILGFPELKRHNGWVKNVLEHFHVDIKQFNKLQFNKLFPNPVDVFALGFGIVNSRGGKELNDIIDNVRNGNHDQALRLALFPLSNPTPINQFVLNAALLKDKNFIEKMGLDPKQLPNLTTEDLPKDKSDEINAFTKSEFTKLVRLGIIEVHGRGNHLSFSLNSKYAYLVNKYVWPKVDPDGSHRKSLLQ